MNGKARGALLAMGLVTTAVLVYEVALTRLLSVVLWYHFAFLSISLAMLGLGASGVWFSLRKRAASAAALAASSALAPALLCAALAIPLSVLVIGRARPLVIDALGPSGWIAVIIVAALVPLYALGYVVCALLIAAQGASVGRMYAADLAGAALGALLVLPGLALLPTPALIAASGLLPLAALALIAQPRARIAAALVAALIAAGIAGGTFRVDYTKTYVEQGEFAPLHEVWTPTARITAFARPIFSPRPDVPWGWGYGANFIPQPWEQRWIDQDGSAGTPVEALQGRVPRDLHHLAFDVTSTGLQLRLPERVCIIGAGGGRDIVGALAAGAREVTAVEINRAIVDLMQGPFAEFSGDIYRRPGVRAVVSEGRSFLAGSSERYDLIQIALVDSWAATAAGAFALSESYLYTVEAFRLYLERLAPEGLLAVSRYTDAVQPFEGARLIVLAEAALRESGVAAPRDHLLFLTGGHVGTLLVSAQPWGAATLERAALIARARGFAIHWPPREGAPPSSLVAVVMAGDALGALDDAGVDLRPPTDDRPFFFQAARPLSFGSRVSELAPGDPNLKSIATLRLVIAVLAVLAVALFFAPFALFARPARGAGFFRASAYFALIGAGFMLLEVALMERCILFLGHPSYAAAFVLGTLLLGGGAGSWLTTKLAKPALRRLLLALAPLTAALALAAGPLFEVALALPLAAKVALFAPPLLAAGALMGLALPAGFLRFGDSHKPWFWAVNGACGVLASALSLALAIEFGLLATSLLGAACYALALALGWEA